MAEQARASITINATPKVVMATIADVEAYPTWSKPVLQTEVLETGPDGRPKRARFEVDATITKDTYTLDYTWDGDDKVSWTLVEGTHQTSQEGSYTLTDNGDGTTGVVYELEVGLKIKVPGLLRRRAQSMITDGALKDLKKHVES